MNNGKKLISLLVVFLLASQIIFPISAFATDSSQDETVNLYQVTQEIALDNGITISEGTYLYGVNTSESIKLQFADSYIEIPLESVSIKEAGENTPVYNEYLLEETSDKIFKPGSLGYSSERFESTNLILNEEIAYPFMVNEDGLETILLGNVTFFMKDIIEEIPSNIQDETEASSDELVEDISSEDADEDSASSNKVVENKSSEQMVEEEIQTVLENEVVESESIQNNKVEKSVSLFRTAIKVDPWEGVSSKYFKVSQDNVIVYDNRFEGALRPVGVLEKNQVYPRVSDYGNWHRIQFGDIYGYVQKESTIPDNGNSLKNKNTSYSNQSRTVVTLQDVVVYDNSSGDLVPFGEIQKGQEYPIASDYGNWWRVIYSDRVGYIRKSEVEFQFSTSDKYFTAEKNTTVYDNRGGGALKPVGQLIDGQTYPRVSDYGNWHRIDFGNFYGYVKKSDTTLATGNEIKNPNTGFNKFRDFTAVESVTVYDNSSGSLVPFGKIEKGTVFPIVSDYGNWWRVIYANRVGYISKSEAKVELSSKDKYFRAFTNLPVYDNRSGSLEKIGSLSKEQVYSIVSDYGNWWRVQYGNIYGYVKKSETGYATKSEVPNLNTQFKNSDDEIVALKNVTVYDNTSGSLVPFGQLDEGSIYPIVSDYGNWWRVLFLDRVGFVRKSDVDIYGINYSKYNITLKDAATKQLKASPQTDIYLNGDLYIRWDAFKSINGTKSGVISSGWRIRTGPGTSYQTAYITNKDIEVSLIKFARDTAGAKWWKISRSSLPDYLGNWVNANLEEVMYNMDPNNFINDDSQKYQFLDLRYFTGISVSNLNDLLAGKGILAGTGEIFRNAAQNAGINELYLVSHALLESGNGASTLAKGVKVNNKTVYNFFGIGAYDNCAVECGAEKAYDEGWFTVEAAILGGAEFAKQNYIYSGQNTLYSMRWNPSALVNGNPSHQYATDVGWARKQVSYYESYYSKGNYNLMFDIPVYK